MLNRSCVNESERVLQNRLVPKIAPLRFDFRKFRGRKVMMKTWVVTLKPPLPSFLGHFETPFNRK